jgi:hypothetical protein
LTPLRFFGTAATTFLFLKGIAMAEVHAIITGANHEANIVFHNPGQVPVPPSAGKAVVATGTPATGTAVHGNINGSTASGPIFDNPA